MSESFSEKKLKICVLFGSPDKNGFDARLLNAFLSTFSEAEVEIFDVFTSPIKGCTACGACKSAAVCPEDDNGFFHCFEECDIFVVAAPIYFLSLPANAKAVLDRFQKYYSIRFDMGIKGYLKKRKSAVIISTCGSDSLQGFEIIKKQWEMAFSVTNTFLTDTVFVPCTDSRFPTQEEIKAISEKASSKVLKAVSG